MITHLQYIDNLTDFISERVIKYTPQIYRKCITNKKSDSPFEAIGSSVLISVQERFFLITAGHIMSDNKRGSWGFYEDFQFHIVDGRFIYINPEIDIKSKYTDVGICELDNISTEFAKRYFQFLNESEIVFDYIPKNEKNFLILGYPWRKTKFNFKKQKIKVTPYKFLTDLFDDGQLGELVNFKNQNLILSYKQRKITDTKTGYRKKAVSPEGLSGCGVWHLPNVYNEDFSEINANLAGIIIRQDIYSHQFVIAVRTHIISELLRLYFDIDFKPSMISRLERTY